MQAFDTSSMIYAWDNYPEGQFPPLWSWMCEQIESRELLMSKVAFDEVGRNMPDCAEWLKGNNLKRLPETNNTLQIALMISGLLGVENDQFGNGVNENDILIIASAKEHNLDLVSNEKRQNILPDVLKNSKIPAVCGMPQVDVTCLNFIEFIRRSEVIFR